MNPIRTPAAPTLSETEPRARIQPLGEQIIIRTIPVGSIGSIILPDSAKGITMMGDGNRPVATEYMISASLLDDLISAIDPKTGRRTNITELLARAEKARKTPAIKNLSDAVHFVEAEVVAVGPGKRQKGDATLIYDVSGTLQKILILVDDAQSETTNEDYLQDLWAGLEPLRESLLDLVWRTNYNTRLPILVKPGDRILYHPAVQKFDRDITDVMQNGNEPDVKYFIIREESVLAIVEKEQG